MSEPVQTFMLVKIDVDKKIVQTLLRDLNQLCPVRGGGHVHRCELEVPKDVTLNDVRPGEDDQFEIKLHDKVIKMECVCGLKFMESNSYPSMRETRFEYLNPNTGKQGDPHEVATPGAMWYCDYLIDRDHDHLRKLVAEGKNTMLSPMYVNQWLGLRSPLTVMCPDGAYWMPDARASNGDGWTVTGQPPKITAHPSIMTPGYHAFLVDGVFGADPACKLYERP